MRRIDLPSAALLVLAAVLVAWVRLLPLSLPTVPELARGLARQRVAARLASERPIGSTPDTPAPLARTLEDWIAAHPAEFEREVAAQAEGLTTALTYADGAGRRRPFLGDYDSYAWLRAARNQLRRGTVCDAVIDGQCRDTFSLAPLGMESVYGRTPHVFAIAAVHRLATVLDPHYPLPASAYLVQVVVGVLGILPAFAIGRRLAGPLGGFFAAVVSGLHPTFLQRSLGSDNDVWNVVLPLYIAWALIAALYSRRTLMQIVCAALSGALVGLHSTEWRGWQFAFVVFFVGQAATLGLDAVRWAVRQRSTCAWRAPGVRRGALVLLVYTMSAAAATHAVAGAQGALPVLWHMVAPGARPLAAPPAPAGRSVAWPSVLATVGELSVPSLGGIAVQSYGHLFFFVGWLGMLLLLLPRQRWQTGHYLVLIGGTLLYRYLLTATGLPVMALVGLLTLPLAAAAVVLVQQRESNETDDALTGVIVAAWLLAALLMSYRASRFILLLAAPFGIATGVAAGRFYNRLASLARAELGLRGWLPGALAGAAVLALGLIPLRIAYRSAAAYLPAIDRAWAEALEQMRTASPPNAIVNTWWDHGYWTKYLAERRVSADGGTLLSHVPHWLARAQLTASEAEAVGLLRMLNCGSDAAPYPERASGARDKLMHSGLDELAAYAAVVRLAALDRPAAERHLAALGLDATARADVLAATHCQPPASYLMLSSRQPTLGGWWRLGAWDATRAYIAGSLRARSADEAVRELTRDLGYGEEEARALYRAAATGDEPARERFISPPGRMITADWVPCDAAPSGARRCRVEAQGPRGGWVEAVEYAEDGGYSAALITRTQRDGPATHGAPDRLSIVTGDGIALVRAAPAEANGIAVLIDADRHRALLGTPLAIDSLFTRLMYLDGRGVRHFRKVDERTSARGQRVVTWAIDWLGGAPAASVDVPGAATSGGARRG